MSYKYNCGNTLLEILLNFCKYLILGTIEGTK